MKNQAVEIQAYLIENVKSHSKDIVKKTITHFNVSRTTVLRHLNRLIRENKIIKSGSTKQTLYMLQDAANKTFHLKLDKHFDEFDYFNKLLQPTLSKALNQNAFDICEYGITEMLNNCQDHSRSKQATLSYYLKRDIIQIIVEDQGIGVFDHIQKTFAYPDMRDAALQLSKGKLTTDTQNHTGEGVFFTSRSFDFFSIEANRLCYLCENRQHDWSVSTSEVSEGTRITMEIQRNTQTNLVDIFQKYQDPESLSFCKTDIMIKLADIAGDRLISRSQAKRIAQNLDKFTHVTLDFTHVQAIGQGFVDQLFRVTKQQLDIEFDYINANSNVEYMIQRSI